MQWVPSHVGVQGNELADLSAGRGAKAAKCAVIAHKSITDIWADLGLQEIPDCYDSDSNTSGGSGLFDRDSDSDVLSGCSGSYRLSAVSSALVMDCLSVTGRGEDSFLLSPSLHQTP